MYSGRLLSLFDDVGGEEDIIVVVGYGCGIVDEWGS